MKTIIFSTVLVLVGCLIVGCSETNRVTNPTTLKNSEIRSDEPFMETIKEIATKRESSYFLGQPIDEAEIERRKEELFRLQDSNLRTSGAREPFMGIPVLMTRF